MSIVMTNWTLRSAAPKSYGSGPVLFCICQSRSCDPLDVESRTVGQYFGSDGVIGTLSRVADEMHGGGWSPQKLDGKVTADDGVATPKDAAPVSAPTRSAIRFIALSFERARRS